MTSLLLEAAEEKIGRVMVEQEEEHGRHELWVEAMAAERRAVEHYWADQLLQSQCQERQQDHQPPHPQQQHLTEREIELQNQLNELSDVVRSCSTQAEEAKAKEEQLLREVSDLRDDNAALQALLTSSSNDRRARKKEVEDLRARLEAAEKNLQDERAEASATVAELQANLKAGLNEVDRLKTELRVKADTVCALQINLEDAKYCVERQRKELQEVREFRS